MKVFRNYFLNATLTSIASYLVLARTALAACEDTSQYEIMAPFATLSGCVGLTEYLSKLMQTVIGISGVLAVVMIVICGIKLMTSGSAGGKSEAKDCITNALFGVLLAVASWLILNTINPLLLKNTPPLMPVVSEVPTPPSSVGGKVDPLPTKAGWYFRYQDELGNIRNSGHFDNQAACDANLKNQKDAGIIIENTPPPSTTHLSKEGGAPECWQVIESTTPIDASESATRESLCGNSSCVNQKPIGINSPACRYDGDPNSCTNVKGLGDSSVSAIKNLQSACGCNITITGGTEYWKHKTHAAGSGVFDLRYDGDTSPLTKSIQSQNPKWKLSFSGNHRWLNNGFWYTYEVSSKNPHWHVCPAGAPYTFCN